VKQLHDIGVIIFVWTPDTPSDWANLKKLGVDGIITNKATVLQGWVSALQQMERFGASGELETSVDMPAIAEQIMEGDDAKVIITSSIRHAYATSSVVMAPRSADLAALALQ